MEKLIKMLKERKFNEKEFLNLRSKAERIACNLGSVFNYYEMGKKGYEYINSKLKIRVEPCDRGNHVFIIYNSTYVLNDDNPVEFVEGRWKELIDFIYEHISEMNKEQDRKKLTLKNMMMIFSNGKEKINIDGIEIIKWTTYTDYEPYWSNSTYQHTDKGITVSEYGNIVFKSILKRDFSEYIYTEKYIPGGWESKIDSYINQLNKENQKEFDQENGKSIDEELSILKKRYK